MLRFNRLFWKICLAFWLANIVIVLISIGVISNTLETAHFHERHMHMAEALAGKVIARYELNTRNFDSEVRKFRQSMRRKRKGSHPALPLSIYDQKTLIFSNRKRLSNQKGMVLIHVEGTSGKEYLVYTRVPKTPRFLKLVFHRLGFMHLVLIVLFSTVVSFFLSLYITNPLKKLGYFSRAYAKGEPQVEMGEKLLKRGDELGDLARALNFMTNEVEKNIESKKQLLHNVSHELRAPLARLQAAAAIIEQEGGGPNSYTRVFNVECENIDALIQEILDYSRQDYEKYKQSEHDLPLAIHCVLDSIRQEFPTRKIIFAEGNGASAIFGNSVLIERAIYNILRNACCHTPAETAIEINLLDNEGNIVMHVIDHGPGISEDALINVFTPFYRSGVRKKRAVMV